MKSMKKTCPYIRADTKSGNLWRKVMLKKI